MLSCRDTLLERRVAVYAILGGVPGYLERFSDHLSLADNVRRHLFRPTGMFRTEPQFLLQDELSQPHNYLAVLLAIAAGNHTQGDISRATGLEHVTSYLSRLQELYFVRRELPVTVPERERMKSRRGRYDLADAYMRFYYRFIHPNQHLLEQGLHDWLWQLISEQLRAFIGTHAFEELCREWILIKARGKRSSFLARTCREPLGTRCSDRRCGHQLAFETGSCWARRSGPAIQLIARSSVGLIAKRTLVVPAPDEDWQVYYAFFSRSGFTNAAVEEARTARCHHGQFRNLRTGFREYLIMKVNQVMKKNVISITVTATVAEAADLLVQYHIGTLPVIDDQNKLVGVLFLSDLLELVHACVRRPGYRILTLSAKISVIMRIYGRLRKRPLKPS